MAFLDRTLGVLAILALVAGCTTAAEHQRNLGSAGEREMTVGVVQKEIRAGLSQAEVAAALGSPNIVTRDADGLYQDFFSRMDKGLFLQKEQL